MLTGKSLIAGAPVDSAEGRFTSGGTQGRLRGSLRRARRCARSKRPSTRRTNTASSPPRSGRDFSIASPRRSSTSGIWWMWRTLETALPPERLAGERARTTGQLRMFANLVREGSWVDARIDRAVPDRTPLPKPDIRRMLIPIGPVAVFGASNFPLAFSVAGGDTASALAAGCPVVVKAHPAHPATSELVARAIVTAARAAGMPPGVFSLIQSTRNDVATALVQHRHTKAVGFTGSLRAGRALFDAAGRRPDPIPVYAEMGSVNPVFLLPGALAERAEAIADGLAASVTLGVGQFCTNPGVVVARRHRRLRPVPAADGGTHPALRSRARCSIRRSSSRTKPACAGSAPSKACRTVRASIGGVAAGCPCARRRLFDTSGADVHAASRAGRGGLRTFDGRRPVRLARRDGSRRAPSRRAADRDDSRHTRGSGGARVAGVDSRGQGGATGRQRLSNRSRGVRVDAARRPVPGDDRLENDVGRHGRDSSLRAAGRLPELSAVVAAARTAGRQPARDLAAGRWRADEGRAGRLGRSLLLLRGSANCLRCSDHCVSLQSPQSSPTNRLALCASPRSCQLSQLTATDAAAPPLGSLKVPPCPTGRFAIAAGTCVMRLKSSIPLAYAMSVGPPSM